MSGPRNAEDRLARLLVMLPWLMEIGEVPLAEVAARFDLTESQVQQDLELVAMCGLPPFVDEMIDVFVDDGLVFVGVPRLFTRPLRLTAPEGFSLLVAGRAAMELPGADVDGSLGRGLAKLARALSEAGVEATGLAGDGVAADGAAGAGAEGDDTSGVAIDLDRPPLTDELVDAAARGAELAVVYFSPARDEATERAIVPRHVFVDAGNWYVLADDDRSGERRTFRVDRIDASNPTGRIVPLDGEVAAPRTFFEDADLPVAVLQLAPAAQWLLDRYPVRSRRDLEVPAGWCEVELPVASNRWLARLLIRLGPNAVVVSPAGAVDDAASLATKMLARYAG